MRLSLSPSSTRRESKAIDCMGLRFRVKIWQQDFTIVLKKERALNWRKTLSLEVKPFRNMQRSIIEKKQVVPVKLSQPSDTIKIQEQAVSHWEERTLSLLLKLYLAISSATTLPECKGLFCINSLRKIVESPNRPHPSPSVRT